MAAELEMRDYYTEKNVFWVPNDCFGAYKLVKPPAQVADAFGKQATLFMRQIKAQDEAAKTLASLRDALLPKLLSGELQVQQAELEAAA